MQDFISQYGNLLLQGTLDTLIMTIASTVLSYIFGLVLGGMLYVFRPKGLRPSRVLYQICSWVVNIGRSIPFIILLVALIPFTRIITGTSLGVTGAIVPLVFAASPFAARLVEQSLLEVPEGTIEAALSFGASLPQIFYKALLPETLPAQIRNIALTFITLFGYAAIAGSIGAGGLGDIAIRFGYQRYQDNVMMASVVICVILVQIAQTAGDKISSYIDKR